MGKPGQPVANTGLLVAAIRAKESGRPDRLFDDPYATRLAGQTGHQLLSDAIAAAGEQSTLQIVVRTRFWDEALLRAVPSIQQVVILAAGMDARAFRLPWPAGTTVYELDQAPVFAAKAEALRDEHPTCERVTIGVDLTDDWRSTLQANGFAAETPSVWLIEGLLQYLDEDAVGTLFQRIDSLSAPSSILLYDVVGRTLLQAQSLAALRRSMAQSGAPWLFGTDRPEELAEQHGWSATVTDVAVPGNAWNRWFTPAVPMNVPDVPRGYFVEAIK
ncbi:MAG: SAM-dependent methyltransferase [Mycobacterium sp.]